MSPPNPLQIILWTWLGLALTALVAAGVFVVDAISDPEDDQVLQNVLRVLALDASIGFTFCAFAAVGKFDAAVYASRFTLLLAVLASLWLLVVEIRTDRSRQGSFSFRARRLLVLSTTFLFTAFLSAISFFIHAAQMSAPLKGFAATPITLPHFAATQLTVAGLGTAAVIFALLFIRETLRTGPIGFETNPGGLGGNMGGWKISASLTFLLASVLCSGLLVALLAPRFSVSGGNVEGSTGEVHKPTPTPGQPEKATPTAGVPNGAATTGSH